MMTRNPGTALSSRYEWELSNRHYPQGGGAAGLGILKEFPHQFYQINTCVPATAARLQAPLNITIVSIYVPPNTTDQDIIAALDNIVKNTDPPFVIGGDFNAAHEVWGSTKTTKRGCILLEWFVRHELLVINTGEPTFISSVHGTTSAIDLTVVSYNLAAKFHWATYDDTLGSDHFPITVTSEQCVLVQRSRKRWIYKDADWAAFESSITNSLSPSEDCVEQLSNIIVSAAEISIPQTSGMSKGRSEIWWTKEVKESVKARRKALRILKRMDPSDPRHEDAKTAFKQARAISRRTISNAKHDSWNQFCQTFNPSTPADVLWGNFNRLMGKRRKGQRGLQIDGSYVQDPSIIADRFADFFTKHLQEVPVSETTWVIQIGIKISTPRITLDLIQTLPSMN